MGGCCSLILLACSVPRGDCAPEDFCSLLLVDILVPSRLQPSRMVLSRTFSPVFVGSAPVSPQSSQPGEEMLCPGMSCRFNLAVFPDKAGISRCLPQFIHWPTTSSTSYLSTGSKGWQESERTNGPTPSRRSQGRLPLKCPETVDAGLVSV